MKEYATAQSHNASVCELSSTECSMGQGTILLAAFHCHVLHPRSRVGIAEVPPSGSPGTRATLRRPSNPFPSKSKGKQSHEQVI